MKTRTVAALIVVTLTAITTVLALPEVTRQDFVTQDRTITKLNEINTAIEGRVAAVEAGTLDSGATVTGDLVLQSGTLQAVQVNVASTNGGTITVGASSTIVINGIGSTAITNTIAAPGAAGLWAVILNNSTNAGCTLTLTEGTTLDSGGDKTLGVEDVMLLFSRSAAAWSAIYHDN
jgi:hypothetical protein